MDPLENLVLQFLEEINVKPIAIVFIALIVIFLLFIFRYGYKRYKINGWDHPFFKR